MSLSIYNWWRPIVFISWLLSVCRLADFTSFEYIPSNRIAESYSSSIFNFFLRNLRIVSYNHGDTFYCHGPLARAPVSSHLLERSLPFVFWEYLLYLEWHAIPLWCCISLVIILFILWFPYLWNEAKMSNASVCCCQCWVRRLTGERLAYSKYSLSVHPCLFYVSRDAETIITHTSCSPQNNHGRLHSIISLMANNS